MTEEHTHAAAQIWLAGCGPDACTDLDALLGLLGPEERLRCARFLRPARRMQYLMGRMLLRLAVLRNCNVAMEDIVVRERPERGPTLCLPTGAPLPHFSISHSGDHVACAVSMSGPVGLDIEMLEPGRDFAALAGQAFTPADHAALLRLQGADRAEAFYRIWTREEALFKLTGSARATARVATTGWHCRLLHDGVVRISLCATHACADPMLIRIDDVRRALALDADVSA